MDFSKLEARQLQLRVQPGNLTWFLRSLLGEFQAQADQQDIAYQIQEISHEIVGYFDADKLEIIIYNLLSNALKFTPAGGAISVTIAEQERKLTLQVQDSGVGVAPEQLPYIFDRFYQADNSTPYAPEGTGIGLALTRELVTLHRGTLAVESTPGEGSRFTLTLPLTEASYRNDKEDTPHHEPELASYPALVKEKAPSPDLAAPIDPFPTLLIIEDHQDLRAYLREQTASAYRVLEAADGEEGWETALLHTPDLIVCDWMMPRLDGRTLCERLKTDVRTSHIPVIMLTARADQRSKLAGLETGADAYLIKPFNPNELLVRMRNLIEQRTQLQVHFRKEIAITPSSIPVNSTDEWFLRHVVEVVEEELANADLTIDSLQKAVGLSRMHLHRKLKALAGQSATEFIRTYRLKRAVQLLAQRADTVSQIAYQVGFSSLSYFSKSFKDQFGCTPSEFGENAA